MSAKVTLALSTICWIAAIYVLGMWALIVFIGLVIIAALWGIKLAYNERKLRWYVPTVHAISKR